ncbi:AGAP006260-PA-like protein [Anopheles sinensis]|uniref:AGAP006260-PA-like protein n=1 Tax=Anopheles sinensis TaxID=74873 RepID=A0A084WKH5_ANOSI|nr:AGAP006260-PA-like protein [Anopheles sinensis]
MDIDRHQFERPAFWRLPQTKTFELPYGRKRVHFSEQVRIRLLDEACLVYVLVYVLDVFPPWGKRKTCQLLPTDDAECTECKVVHRRVF